MSATSDVNHFLFIPTFAFSHVRVLLQLALNLLSTHPSLISTFLIPSTLVEGVNREIALKPDGLLKGLEGRWRIKSVDVEVPPGTNYVQMGAIFTTAAEGVLRSVLSGSDEGNFSALPCAVVFDVRWRSPALSRLTRRASIDLQVQLPTPNQEAERRAGNAKSCDTSFLPDHGP